MPGGNLYELVHSDEPLSWRMKIKISSDVATGTCLLIFFFAFSYIFLKLNCLKEWLTCIEATLFTEILRVLMCWYSKYLF
jgi:hypothetical protein